MAGIGLTTGAINQDAYAQIVGMAIITTFVTPILLKRSFSSLKIEVGVIDVPVERDISG